MDELLQAIVNNTADVSKQLVELQKRMAEQERRSAEQQAALTRALSDMGDRVVGAVNASADRIAEAERADDPRVGELDSWAVQNTTLQHMLNTDLGRTLNELARTKTYFDQMQDTIAKGLGLQGHNLDHWVNQVMDRVGTRDISKEDYHKLVESTRADIKREQELVRRNQTANAFLAGDDGLEGGLVKFKNSLFAELPMGGLLGLLLYGEMKDDEWRATGQRIAQGLEQTGGDFHGFALRMKDYARDLWRDFAATPQEISAVVSTLGSAGEKATEETANMVDRLLRLDKAMEAPAGTFANIATTIKREFGTVIPSAVTDLEQLATAAKNAGMSGLTMVQALMAMTSQLRMTGDHVKEVGSYLLDYSKHLDAVTGSEKGTMQGVAIRGMHSALGAFAGLQEGWAAVLAEDIGMDVSDPLAAIFHFKTGGRYVRGSQQEFLKSSLAAMDRYISDVTGGTDDVGARSGAVMKMFGVNEEGAQALQYLMKVAQTSELTAQDIKAFEDAFKNEGLKTSEMERMMRELRDGIAQLGAALLDGIVTGLKLIVSTLTWGFAKVTALFGGTIFGANADEYADKIERHMIENLLPDANRFYERSSKAMEQLMSAAKRIKLFDTQSPWLVLPDMPEKAPPPPPPTNAQEAMDESKGHGLGGRGGIDPSGRPIEPFGIPGQKADLEEAIRRHSAKMGQDIGREIIRALREARVSEILS